MATRRPLTLLMLSGFPWAALIAALWLPLPAEAAPEWVGFPSLDAPLTGGAPTELRGLLFRPSGAGPFPAVVGLHGCGGLLDNKGALQARETAWAGVLTERGYVMLFVDSFTPRHQAASCRDNTPPVYPWRERMFDVYGALTYLQQQPFVLADRIGLMGWSHGGGTLMFSIDRHAKARPARLPKGDFRAAVAFYPGWCSAQYLGSSWGSDIPLLLLMGGSDDWTPARPCLDVMRESAPGEGTVETHLYDGAYHDFDWPGMPLHTITVFRGHHSADKHVGLNPAARADALQRVPAFLDRYLKPELP
jgi:dienelactone hydrolase